MRYAMILAVLALVGCEGPMGPAGTDGADGQSAPRGYVLSGPLDQNHGVTVDLPADAGTPKRVPAVTCYYSDSPTGPTWMNGNRTCAVVVTPSNTLQARMWVYAAPGEALHYKIVVQPV